MHCAAAHLRGPAARPAQGNQNQNAAALARRSIDVCAQARATSNASDVACLLTYLRSRSRCSAATSKAL